MFTDFRGKYMDFDGGHYAALCPWIMGHKDKHGQLLFLVLKKKPHAFLLPPTLQDPRLKAFGAPNLDSEMEAAC